MPKKNRAVLRLTVSKTPPSLPVSFATRHLFATSIAPTEPESYTGLSLQVSISIKNLNCPRTLPHTRAGRTGRAARTVAAANAKFFSFDQAGFLYLYSILCSLTQPTMRPLQDRSLALSITINPTRRCRLISRLITLPSRILSGLFVSCPEPIERPPYRAQARLTSLSKSGPNSTPACFAASGSRLFGVKPGRVLISSR